VAFYLRKGDDRTSLSQTDKLKRFCDHDKYHDSMGIKNGRNTAPPKCDNKDDPQVLRTSFPKLLTLSTKGNGLNAKAMIT